MNLRFINISLDETIGDIQYRLWFEYHTRFISNYLSRKIRSYHYSTDGSFDMINIDVGTERNPQIVVNNVLEVYLPFDQERYNKVKGTNDHSYYIEMFRQGFHQAYLFKNIPIVELNSLLDEFESNHCKHIWIHLKRTLKAAKLRVELIAQFTTNNYTLTANFYDLSKSELLCTGTLIKTLPDEVFFSRTIKDIIDDSEKVIFLDYNLNNLIIMNVSDIRAKCFKFSFSDCAYQDDEKAIETHKELIQYLSYNG